MVQNLYKCSEPRCAICAITMLMLLYTHVCEFGTEKNEPHLLLAFCRIIDHKANNGVGGHRDRVKSSALVIKSSQGNDGAGSHRSIVKSLALVENGAHIC